MLKTIIRTFVQSWLGLGTLGCNREVAALLRWLLTCIPFRDVWTKYYCHILSPGQNTTDHSCHYFVQWDKIWQRGTEYCSNILSGGTKYDRQILSGPNIAALFSPLDKI